MSNKRSAGKSRRYRSEFLRSPAWFARRDRWFAEQSRRSIPLRCEGCLQPATKTELELHHLDYRGVTERGGTWRAGEPHTMLVPLHPYCHDLLHRLIDRDLVLARHRSRATATRSALAHLRTRLATPEDAS